MRGRAFIACLGVVGAFIASACVGDDPTVSPQPPGADGGNPTGDGSTPDPNNPDSSNTNPDGGPTPDPPPTPQDKVSWAHYVPTQINAERSFIARDAAGYTTVLSRYTGSADGVPAVTSGAGLYIARLDPEGKTVWKKGVPPVGTPNNRITVGGIAVDDAGDIFLAFSTQAMLDFGNNVKAVGSAIEVGFVVKLGRMDGTAVWRKEFKSPSDVFVYGLDVRKDSIAIIGQFYNGITFDKAAGPTTTPGYGMFAARLDRSTGNTVWLANATAVTQLIPGCVTLDDAGNVYAGFQMKGDVTGWGNPKAASSGAQASDGLVVSLDAAAGASRWSKVIGKAGNTTQLSSVKAIAWNAGQIAIVGSIPQNFDLGDGKGLGTTGPSDPYVAVLSDTDAKLKWAKAIGNDRTTEFDEALDGVAMDRWGQVIAVGRYRSPMTVGGKALPTSPAAANPSAFGVKLDAQGAVVWSKAIVGSTWAQGDSVAVANSGDIIASFHVAGTNVNLGAGVTVTTPSSGVCLAVNGWSP